MIKKYLRWLFLLFLLFLGAMAFYDYSQSEFTRKTFVFYSIEEEAWVVEERMIKLGDSQEINITRYVEDALLGPFTQNCLPLFPIETRLLSLLYDDNVVYINLSEDAAMPHKEGGEVLKSLKTLYSGIKRNFSSIKDIRIFIMGRAVFPEELAEYSKFAAQDGLW